MSGGRRVAEREGYRGVDRSEVTAASFLCRSQPVYSGLYHIYDLLALKPELLADVGCSILQQTFNFKVEPLDRDTAIIADSTLEAQVLL